jgi:hypothetical protein
VSDIPPFEEGERVKKLVAIGIVFAMIPAHGFAQGNKRQPKDLKAEIAKCASASTALRRLACFDELTLRLGIEIPKEGQIATSSKDQEPQKPKPKDDGKQKARMKFIQEAMKVGVLQKIEFPGEMPHMWVTPTFHSLDFEVKQNLCLVVFQYYKIDWNPKLSLVILKDSKSGKRIGNCSPELGLRLD